MQVLLACLDPEPAKRMTALEVIALPYFDDVHTLIRYDFLFLFLFVFFFTSLITLMD